MRNANTCVAKISRKRDSETTGEKAVVEKAVKNPEGLLLSKLGGSQYQGACSELLYT